MSGSNVFEVELEALRSIYENDLQTKGDTVTIHVHHLQNMPGNDVDAKIDLEVVCPLNYPEVLPNISLKNPKGLSNKQVTTLTAELESLADSLRGKPMIFDLACHVLNYLLDNNRPFKKSFYDEMISRKQQELAKFKSAEDRRLRKIYDAQQKVRKKIEENNSSDEDDFDGKSSISNRKNEEINLDYSRYEKTEDRLMCSLTLCKCSKYINFERKVLRGQCLGHYACSTLYYALDTVTGEQLVIHEWNLKPRSVNCDVEKLLKSIQNELNYLKILNQENLSSYIDFKCISDKVEWTVYIAEKYVSNVTLKTLLDHQWIFDIDVVQYIIENILQALLYLHAHKVVHKDLNEANVYITEKGSIKLGSYSLKKRMDDVFRLCNVEAMPDTKDKTDQKTDIRQLGVILNKIIGSNIKRSEEIFGPDPKLLEFKDFIDKCLMKNEERRWGALELLEHKFLKNNSTFEPCNRRKSSDMKLGFEANEVEEQLDFSVAQPSSRLSKDFYILEDIGKGSFGKVLKVRNKLDRQIYAIKEIKLDKNSEQLDRKIIGEVKLLSKLKHENVVRYYTSWIETYSDSKSNIESSDVNKTEEFRKGNKGSKEKEEMNDEYDSDDEDDGDSDSSCGFWREEQNDDSSFIVFQEDDKEESIIEVNEKSKMQSHTVQPIRIMYIQMEFCEKSTLKYAIQNNLYNEELRCWRLLREIVEGLTYIHEQGLIHRDLKPDNIFLDLNDHVKIGDFGLAKIREMSKCTLIITGVSLGGGDQERPFVQGDSNTAGVGTSYYVAPEMNTAFEKSHYNEKVDIFSLGIIFFEMCHPPFNTGMERHDVLIQLRKPECVVPFELDEKMPRQMELVRKLLTRDPASRPSSQEILQDHMPPAEVEYEELKEIVRKTLLSPESKGYKYLMSSCFNQKISIDEDITYQLQNVHSDKFHISLEMAKESVESIFKKRGAIYLSTPLLLPQDDVYANIDSRVKLMTVSGTVVNLSHDLRVPFARYVTWKNIRRFRRYTIDRIHREHKSHGILRKELYECAFDIVSPTSVNVTDEWEILSVMDEVVTSSSSLKSRNCVIVMNHALILRALLIYCNVEKVYSEIFKFLMEAKVNRLAKRQLEANLLSLELGVQVVNILVTYFGKEETVYALKEELLSLFSNSKEASEKAERGFEKLIKIIEEAENFGISVPVRVRLGVVCNTEYCSDLMFDLVCKTKQKRGKMMEVIMSGCRYDGLIRYFRKLFSVMNDIKETNVSAIGVSISLDKVASLLKEDNILSEYVVVCSTDNWISNEAKIQFLRELRESGIKCHYEDATHSMEELLEYCGENKISHLVNLKEENDLVLVMSWDNEKYRYREKKISKKEVIEYLLKNSKSSEDHSPICYQRSDSKMLSSEISTANHSFSIHILSEEKSTITRRKYENQIRSKTAPLLQCFSPKTRIEIIGVDLDEAEIMKFAMSFKHDDTSCKFKILSTAERSSKKSYLSKICAKLESFLTVEKSNLIMILYGLGHDKYQIIMGQ